MKIIKRTKKNNYYYHVVSRLTGGGGGSSAKLYSAPGYLPPEPQRPQTVPCSNGRACVPKYQCQGGSVDASQIGGQRNQVKKKIRFLNWC